MSDDLMALLRDQALAERQALAHTRREQHALNWGDHFLRWYDMPEGVLAIFGRIPTLEEFSAVEDPHTVERYQEDLMSRGYRFGWCHSVIEPRGEPGDTHVSQCWPITEEQFLDAKDKGWDPTKLPWIADIGPDPDDDDVRTCPHGRETRYGTLVARPESEGTYHTDDLTECQEGE